MPDPTKQTVSASQMPMILGVSPYGTEWMLYHHFLGQPMPEVDDDPLGRIWWGTQLEPVILAATAQVLRLDVTANTAKRYVRRDALGATIDGHTMAPDRGKGVIEAKNIDWLRWRKTWTEEQAAPHVEIQTQVGMFADSASWGVISGFIGGNDLRLYMREPNRELIQHCEERATLFLERVRDKREPDPLAIPIELPMMAQLYPETVETEVVEDLEDEDLPGAIREFDRARALKGSSDRLQEQMKAKILAKARIVGTDKMAGVLRANGVTAYIKRSARRAQICKPHTEEKVLKAAGSQVNINVVIHDYQWTGSLQAFLEGGVNA